MLFASDNRAGISDPVVAAIAEAGRTQGGAYGDDELTRGLNDRFAEVFEHPVSVYPVGTGTAANSLALASLCDPWGAFLCSDEAHVLVDESGAPEFFGSGMRPTPIDLDQLEGVLARRAYDRDDIHRTPLQAISLTNLSESGTVLDPDATRRLTEPARRAGLAVHLDGARFANAVVATGASPAELSWQAGVDVLSFGGTKNGAMAAEAVVCFDPDTVEHLERRRKRSGHLFSKMRFISAQLHALLADGHWLDNARHANATAAELARGLAELPDVEVQGSPAGNMVFVDIETETATRWRTAGAQFYDWAPSERGTVVRLVTNFATTSSEVTDFLALAANVESTPGPSSQRAPEQKDRKALE